MMLMCTRNNATKGSQCSLPALIVNETGYIPVVSFGVVIDVRNAQRVIKGNAKSQQENAGEDDCQTSPIFDTFAGFAIVLADADVVSVTN